MKILKGILKISGIILVVYWSIHGVMALFGTGYRWKKSGFDIGTLRKEYGRRFLS